MCFPSLYQTDEAMLCLEYGVTRILNFNRIPSQASPEFNSLGNIIQLSPLSVLRSQLPFFHLLITTMIQKRVVLIVIHTCAIVYRRWL